MRQETIQKEPKYKKEEGERGRNVRVGNRRGNGEGGKRRRAKGKTRGKEKERRRSVRRKRNAPSKPRQMGGIRSHAAAIKKGAAAASPQEPPPQHKETNENRKQLHGLGKERRETRTGEKWTSPECAASPFPNRRPPKTRGSLITPSRQLEKRYPVINWRTVTQPPSSSTPQTSAIALPKRER